MQVQVSAIEAFTAVLDLRLLTGPDVVDVLLPSVLANVNTVGSTDEVCDPEASVYGFKPSIHIIQHRTS